MTFYRSITNFYTIDIIYTVSSQGKVSTHRGEVVRVAIWLYARPNKSNLAFEWLLDWELLALKFLVWLFDSFWPFWASLTLKTFVWL